MVVAVEGGVQGRGGAGDGGLEARGLRDDKVGRDAPIGPAADAELVGFGEALRDGVVAHGHVVLVVLVAPIGPNRFGVAFAVPGGAAGVWEQDGVAVGSKELREVRELGVIGPDGSTVRAQDCGIFFAGGVVERLVKVAGDGGAVFAFEVDVFGLDKLELGEEGVVRLGEAREFVAGGGLRVDFAGAVGHVDLGGDAAILSERIGIEHEAPRDGAGDLAAGYGDAGENLRAVVIGDEVNGVAVRREARLAGIAVERLGEDAGWAASGGRPGGGGGGGPGGGAGQSMRGGGVSVVGAP